MKIRKCLLLFFAIALLSGTASVGTASADSDDRYGNERNERYGIERNERYGVERDERSERRERYENNRGKGKQRFLSPVNNALYSEECSSCHFLYLPGLLPSGSWNKILDGSEDHFGEDLALEKETTEAIRKYLVGNAAETTRARRAVKIMKSLKGETPLRITKVRYIIREHHEIRSGVFKRESIGSFSNCGACHTTADKGIFEEHYIRIPRR